MRSGDGADISSQRKSNHGHSVARSRFQYHRLAYEKSYAGGFYYGDLIIEEGGFPPCFLEDLDCQRKSDQREDALILMLFGILVICVIVFCLVYR